MPYPGPNNFIRRTPRRQTPQPGRILNLAMDRSPQDHNLGWNEGDMGNGFIDGAGRVHTWPTQEDPRTKTDQPSHLNYRRSFDPEWATGQYSQGHPNQDPDYSPEGGYFGYGDYEFHPHPFDQVRDFSIAPNGEVAHPGETPPDEAPVLNNALTQIDPRLKPEGQWWNDYESPPDYDWNA